MVSLSAGGNTNMTRFSPGAALQMNNSMPLVLIVEDNDDSRLMLKLLLKTWGYRILEATDGEEAVQIAKDRRPDLILMDSKLPGLDGFDATRRIRESAEIGNVPIFFISACAEPIYLKVAQSAGANEYLTKPLDFETLKMALDKYVSH